MIFWEHFLRLLPYRPKQALAALYWYITRRKVRARNRLNVASIDLPFAYRMWIRTVERKSLQAAAPSRIKDWQQLPRFVVLLYARARGLDADPDRSVKSVQHQIYPYWKLVDSRLTGLARSISGLDGDYVVPLCVGDLLSETALFRFAEALQANAGAAVLYGDQDEFDDEGRHRPWFKPSWNEELFLAQDYLADAVAIETTVARTNANQSGDSLSNLLISATEDQNESIVHVPHILTHVSAGMRNVFESARFEAVGRRVRPHRAKCSEGPYGTIKVEWPLPSRLPQVSIIVPTKDKLELLGPCIGSVLELTDYDNFEILIVDNGSVERRTADYFARLRQRQNVRVLEDHRAYNFSAINNLAVQRARGSYLCFLNNDTEVLEPSWLTELMRHAVRPHVGAVGAKLLYEDGSIQHAGVVIGIGDAAGHAHRFLAPGQPGYFQMAHVAQYVSAVTAACLVVQKEKFLHVGGFDEVELAVAFNDVDLCLKLEKAGWRNVYVPHAVLTHHESKSRGEDSSPVNIHRYQRELKTLQDRWGTRTYRDPLHNPNLDRYSETFIFGL